jgi:uncharacterized protein YjiS (DUF1127 family)
MTPQKVIFRLAKELAEKVRDATTKETLQGALPPEVKKLVDTWSGYGSGKLWAQGDKDLVALVAVAWLLYRDEVAPLSRLSATRLQIEYGANVFSPPATRAALRRMREARRRLVQVRSRFELLVDAGKILAARPYLGGPANASQIALDGGAYTELSKRCDGYRGTVDRIVERLDTAIEINEDLTRAHQKLL